MANATTISAKQTASIAPNAAPRTAIVGVGGYAGGELARILFHHAKFGSTTPTLFGRPEEAKTGAITFLEDLHPQLAMAGHRRVHQILPFSWERAADSGIEILFLATPHEQSRDWVPTAIAQGIKVIDLSGAWRLQHDANRAVYKLHDADPTHAAQLQSEAVYGCPELHRNEISNARLVANPGCYATSIILALAPLIEAGIVDIDHGIICDSKSGVSGAGKAPTANTHFMHAADNLSAYAVFGHRHTGELLEQLHLTSEQIQFTPHLLPIPRGIMSTIYLRLKQRADAASITTDFRVLLCQQSISPAPSHSASAGDPTHRPHQLLRPGIRPGSRWQTTFDRLLPRQSPQGSRRAGSAEHESHVRMERRGGFAVRFVVKLGGVAIEDRKILHAAGKAIAELVADGNQVAVVHGGGVQLTRTLAQMGKKSEFVSGLRITDAETRDAALMVLAGRVNKSLVAAIGSHGQQAVGLSGGDGHVFRARKKKTNPDLGFVGEIAAADPRWLEAIWTMGAVPVISSIALGFDGEYYNINADEMAAACAISTKADTLVFLTDVPGVKGADGNVMRWLTLGQIPAMEKAQVVSGGMLPKLNACREALTHGVKRVRILPAEAAGLLPDLVSTRVNDGTEVMVA